MKQTLFATRQRAEELLREVLSIWRQSNQSEQLEGLENDPVLALLITALAYKANEMENDIERLQEEVLEEFTRMLVPYELCHAVPATVVVKTALQPKVPEVWLDSSSSFTLANTDYRFMPMLRTKVINAQVKSVVRMDARRWKVSLTFPSTVSDLSGMTFLISNPNFHDLKVTSGGQPLSLTKPWDYVNLPLASCFSLDTMLYSKAQTYSASAAWFDLFARQNMRMFCINPQKMGKLIPFPTEKMDFVFEFFGIADNFAFGKADLHLNCVFLANVEQQTAQLSNNTPILRIAGNNGQASKDERQFLHLMRPSMEQLYAEEPVIVRRIATERFNANSLFRLVSCLIDKFSSDFYAFQQFSGLRDGKNVYQIYELLHTMLDEINKLSAHIQPGVYLMLKKQPHKGADSVSLSLSYLLTSGAQVNSQLNANSLLVAPPEFVTSETKIVSDPQPGHDEVQGVDAQNSLARYYLITNDRIVTPADIKIFCYNELLVRYAVTSDMIDSILVRQRPSTDRTHCGYEIVVEIGLKANPFIKRSFTDKIPQVECLLQKMIEVRSTHIYPIQVILQIR
ncbi:MAG: hypothetical protein ACI30I_04375 [Parabacteroides sp.]